MCLGRGPEVTALSNFSGMRGRDCQRAMTGERLKSAGLSKLDGIVAYIHPHAVIGITFLLQAKDDRQIRSQAIAHICHAGLPRAS